jgi:hypothetical protein
MGIERSAARRNQQVVERVAQFDFHEGLFEILEID